MHGETLKNAGAALCSNCVYSSEYLNQCQ